MWLHADIKSLGDIPRYHARQSANKIALTDAAARSMTFGELNDTSNRIAQAIIGNGIPPRSHIAFFGKNSIEYIQAVFGAAKANCALLPLNWRLAQAELALVIEDAAITLMMVDREYRDIAAYLLANSATRWRVVEFDSTAPTATSFSDWFAPFPAHDPELTIDPLDTALLMYTSGTTGKPKGVQLTHQGLNFMRLCEHLEPAYQWHPNDKMVFLMPNFHLVGTGLSIQGLYNGVPLSILPAADMGKLIELIARDRPTICCMVPTAIQMLLDHPDAKSADFSSLRLVMYAGSAINMKLLKRALTEMKCEFMQFYGATESSGAATLLRPEQHDLNNEGKLKSCGTPLPLIEIRIVDAAGDEVVQGEIGEMLIRSPTMFSGYWNQADTTAAALDGGWYRSGDAGYRDSDGLIYIVDRVKDMIVSGGENIYSTEVEQALVTHPAVAQVAVIGLPDDHWGERVTAVIVAAKGQSVDEEALISHCRKLIAGYKAPKSIFFAPSLPMTASGKVLKTALRDQYKSAVG
jgi:acyl-CoA synthetase (AMP-forming)/AMP-acid ligase II